MRRLVAILACSVLLPTIAGAFSDVPASHPHADAIEALEDAGVISGYANGTFRPAWPINRAEFLKIVFGALVVKVNGKNCDKVHFTDTKQGAWYSAHLCAAVEQQIIKGYPDGSFRPGSPISLAEAATIIAKIQGEREKEGAWYETGIRHVSDEGAIPLDIPSLTRPLTRGQMAEILYRIMEGEDDLPSHTYESIVATMPVTPASNVKIPILVYHHIRPTDEYDKSTWSWKMSVSPSIFNQHMQWLHDRGYTTIDLATAVAILTGKEKGPSKPVVITFDDNQLSAYELGVPTMKKYKQMAVFYLITSRIGSTGALSKAQIQELHAMGMDIESHTVTHRVLPALSVTDIDWEFQESRRILEELIQKPIDHIAYPGTAHDATVRARAKALGYQSATIMDPRNAVSSDDLFRLPRIMMTDDTDLTKVLP